MWKKKLRNSKGSFILISMILMVTSALLSTAYIFIDSIDNSINEYYSDAKLPDVYLFNSSHRELEMLERQMDEAKLITDYQEYEAFYSSMNLNKVNEDRFNEDRNLIIAIDSQEKLNWHLTILEGEKKSAPASGEIWISKILADKKGFQVNDDIEIDRAPNRRFSISAIINDSQNASLANPAKIMYINEQDVSLFDEDVKGGFAVFQYAGDKAAVSDYIHHNLSGNEYYMERFYLILNQLADTGLVSVIMTFAGVLTLISGIIVVVFTLKNNLIREVKSIGTYKALGFRPSEIKDIYSQAYLVIGLISTSIGVLFSFPAAYFLQKNILQYLGSFDMTIRYLVIGGIIILLFNIIIQLFVSRELRKINKVSPIDAMETGDSGKGNKRSWILFKNTSNPISLAINDIFKNKRMSFNVVLITAIYTFTTLLFINIDHLFKVSDEHANIWLNLHKTTATINTDITSKPMEEDLVSYLNKDEGVKNYGYGLYLNAGNYIKYDNERYEPLDVYAIESFSSYDDLGFEVYEGRLPQKFNEINVSVQLLKNIGLEISDKMSFKINGQDESFLVVGSFGSIKYGGNNVRFLNETMDYYELDPYYNVVTVQLEDEVQYDSFKRDFENKFEGTFVQSNLGNYNDLLSDMTSMVPPVVRMITIFMLILSALNIVTIVSIIMINERRNFGIQKSLGFTNGFLKTRILTRIIMLTLAGILASIIIHVSVSHHLVELVITSPNAIIFSPMKTMLYCVLIFSVMLLFSLWGSSKVERINTIELMEE